MDLRPGALVLYRGQPALVEGLDGRVRLRLPDGQQRRVRPKDVLVLHPGPARLDRVLQARPMDLQEVWEVLQDEPQCTLQDLVEFILGEFSPEGAWAAWQALEQQGWFEGTPQALRPRTPEERSQWLERQREKARKAQAWQDFLQRARQDQVDPLADQAHLQDVIALALARTTRSRVLQALGLRQSPEEAHRLLLQWGVWSPRYNPYPRRLGLELKPPQLELPDLPQEPRQDLTHLIALAIDDEGSQDPDDALSWEGEWLWIHVADVAALVPPESPADLEARQRGSSIYLPEGVVPMLPDQARVRLALGLQDPSPALSIGVRLDAEGEIRAVRVVPSWVRVTRLTYEEAEARLDREPWLQVLWERLQVFARWRQARGAVDLHLPEVKVRVEEDGHITVRPLPWLRSRSLVQEAMLLAGAAVARFAQEHGLTLPYTAQPPPREPDEPLPSGLAGMVAQRRLLAASEYKAHPEPHHGLGLPAYVQATSPLRRYLDLVVHQQLRAFLQGRQLLSEQELLERVGMAEAARRIVRQAERLSRTHWICVYLLEQAPQWRGLGVVVRVKSGHAEVLIPQLGLEERVAPPFPVELNQELPLQLQGVNLPYRRVLFRVYHQT